MRASTFVVFIWQGEPYRACTNCERMAVVTAADGLAQKAEMLDSQASFAQGRCLAECGFAWHVYHPMR